MLSSQLRCAIVVSSNLISLEVVLNMITTDGMKIEIGFLSCKDGCDNLSGLFLDGGEAGFRDAHWSCSWTAWSRPLWDIAHDFRKSLRCQRGAIFLVLQDNRSDSLLSHHVHAVAPTDWSRFLAVCLLTSLSSDRTGFNAARLWPRKFQDEGHEDLEYVYGDPLCPV